MAPLKELSFTRGKENIQIEELKYHIITLKIAVPQRQERLHKLFNTCFEGAKEFCQKEMEGVEERQGSSPVDKTPQASGHLGKVHGLFAQEKKACSTMACT